MHEWALAEAVVATVDKIQAENGGKPVLAVRVRIGELQKIEMEAFRQGLGSFLEGRPFGIDVFHFDTEEASFLCNGCGREWLLDSLPELDAEEREAIHFLPESAHVYVRCPYCGSPDFRLQKGRGVSIESVELELRDD